MHMCTYNYIICNYRGNYTGPFYSFLLGEESGMLLWVVLTCLLLNFVPESLGKLCEDISGRWSNRELGSEAEIDHLPDGRMRGKYYTAISLASGKVIGHDLHGVLPYNKPGSSFAFSVTWNNGSSTKVWTGQCLVCDGKETLETSWLLRSFVDSCIDKWKSTLIGKDIFCRKADKTGKQERSENDLKTIKEPSPGSKCNLRGVWYNDVGSEVILNQTKYGVITGEYRTSVEKEKGSAGTSHSLVYGTGAYGNPNSTFSLIVVWRGGKSVTGWVGQCHICGVNQTEVLEMNWLLRSKVDSCRDVWKSTLFSLNSFTRYAQRTGPRKSLGTHTPNRDGEDIGDETGSSPKIVVPCLWLTFVLVYGNIEMM